MSDFNDSAGATYHRDADADADADADSGEAGPATYHSDADADSGDAGPATYHRDADAATTGLVSSASAPAANQVSSAWAESKADEAANAPTSTGEATGGSDASAAGVPTVYLSAVEARVLGSLIEKSYLTPDTYPMTTNAMVTACNQKTNRDPVVAYTAVDVDAVLLDLRQRNLVRRVHSQGSRSTKHRQTLDEELVLNEQQLALISVLLLRGAQTIGELRLRTERHDVGFDDLDAVENCLVTLASRQTPLVVQLARQPGHKEARWQHLLADDTDDAAVASAPVAEADAAAVAAPAAASSAAPPSALEGRVVTLEAQVATLQQQLAALAGQLGETLE